jgi:hypothetical protein
MIKSTNLIKLNSEQPNVYAQIAQKLTELLGFDKMHKLNINEEYSSKSASTKSTNKTHKYANKTSKENSSSRFSEQEKELIEQKKRTTLREEILIHNQFQNKVPSYYDRKNFDLLRIVEDQVTHLCIQRELSRLILKKLI